LSSTPATTAVDLRAGAWAGSHRAGGDREHPARSEQPFAGSAIAAARSAPERTSGRIICGGLLRLRATAHLTSFESAHRLSTASANEPMTLTNYWPLRSYLELGALPSAAPHARQHTSQMLRNWDLGELAEPTELVVSELITNAIQASCGEGGDSCVRLRLFSDGARVAVQVWDNCPEPPQLTHAGSTDEVGRGLLLVEAMTTSWDWYVRDGGKIVWAVLQFSPLLSWDETQKPPRLPRQRSRRGHVTMLPAAPVVRQDSPRHHQQGAEPRVRSQLIDAMGASGGRSGCPCSPQRSAGLPWNPWVKFLT